jgi:rare lipoprotein A
MRSAARWLAVGALSCAAQNAARPADAPSSSPSRSLAKSEAAPSAKVPEPGEVGLATYYARSLAFHRTASGERYDPNLLTAAHRTLPFGTRVEVRRADGRSVVVRINDRGPFRRGRIIDLSERAAAAIGLLRDGVAEVELRVLPGASD